MSYKYLLLFLPFFITSCNSKIGKLKDTTIQINIDTISYSLNLYDISNALHFDEVIRTVPNFSDTRIRNFSDKIMQDSIVVLHTFKPYYLPIESITWAENPENNIILPKIQTTG